MKALTCITLAGLAAALPMAVSAMTVADYWNEVSRRPGVSITQRPSVTVVTDPESMMIYYFTRPNNPAHPGLIIRKRVSDGSTTFFDTETHSDTNATATPAFRAWLANPLQ